MNPLAFDVLDYIITCVCHVFSLSHLFLATLPSSQMLAIILMRVVLLSLIGVMAKTANKTPRFF